VIDEAIVEVPTAKMSVTSSSLDLKDAFFDCQQGDIESSATKIEEENVPLAYCSRLVNDTEYIKAIDCSSILGSLTSGIIEVSRNGDNHQGYFFRRLGEAQNINYGNDKYEWNLQLLVLSTVVRFATLIKDFKGDMFNISISELGTKSRHAEDAAEMLGKLAGDDDGNPRIMTTLILGGITNETLRLGQ